MMAPRVLSVGQCGYDRRGIGRQIQKSFGVEVRDVDTHVEALEALRAGAFRLVLVNRIGDADDAPGLDLVRALKADPDLSRIPVMLVSDHAEAQIEAVGLGALPGFGKADLVAARTLQRLAEVLGGE